MCVLSVQGSGVRSLHTDDDVPSLMDAEKEMFALKRRIGSYYAKGLYDDALECALALRSRVSESLGQDNAIFASSLNNVALMHKMLGNHAESMELYTEALHVYYESVGREHHSYASTLTNLGAMYKSHGEAARGLERDQVVERCCTIHASRHVRRRHHC